MAYKLDQIIIIDVESTCWERGKEPPDEKNEIIEIGICVLDTKAWERVEKRSIIVKPEYSKVSEFCEDLTTLTQEEVDKGISFKEACEILRKEYKIHHRTWASWGDYDRIQFHRDSKRKKVDMPFGRTHINIKNLYAVKNQLNREIALKYALEKESIQFEGTPHRGTDDAWNMALILARLLCQ